MYFGDAGSAAVLHSIGAAHAKFFSCFSIWACQRGDTLEESMSCRRCAVITLDTPGANYRTVWALHKHFPHIKTYVRAHDVTHGVILEKVLSCGWHTIAMDEGSSANCEGHLSLIKHVEICIWCTARQAGATAVVPETLEPSLQLASAVLSQLNMPADEVAQAVQSFRRNHVSELQALHSPACLCLGRLDWLLLDTVLMWDRELVQVLCKTSGSSLGYGFSTVDDDDEEAPADPAVVLALAEAVP